MGYDTPEQAFIVFGNLNWSVILVAGHQPDLPVVAQFNVFHGETLGSDAYGKVSPLGFEHPVYNHRIAVLDVVVNQGEALYLSEEGADRVGNQLFVQVDKPLGGNIALCLICLVGMFLLYRQILLLSLDDQEGRLLGVNVTQIRLIVLLIATLAASSVISMTGLISFISLLAPHGARLLFKNNRLSTMLFSGLLGGCLLTLGDIFARSIASTELPVSIFTSLLGAPFLIYLCIRRKPLQ